MVKARVIETDVGIQGEVNVRAHDRMMRRMRGKGCLETGLILSSTNAAHVIQEIRSILSESNEQKTESGSERK